MSRSLAGLAWIGLYLVVVLAPIGLMLVPPVPTGRTFWVELSIALGFVGLTQIGIQFVLIARFRPLTTPYGMDVVLTYHRQIALVAIAFIVAHPVLLLVEHPARAMLLHPFGGTYASKLGLASVATLVLLAATSIWRARLGLGYERWRVLHTALGVGTLAFAQAHVSLAGLYINAPWKQGLWIASSVVLLGLVVHLRLVVPARQRRRPWRVARVRDEGGGTYRLELEADDHDGMRFLPGQFAWIKTGASPYTVDEHPFSFASSAERPGRIAFGIKALGDFSSRVPGLAEGTRVYVDGPHGAFSIDRAEAPGYVLLAGGIGVTPMLSILHTMADRRDTRPVHLVYAAASASDLAFRDEIAALAERVDLTVTYVLEAPPDGWTGETGLLTPELLARVLPDDERIARRYFVCGPPPMMEATEAALRARGVPPAHILLEQFALA